jgi:hypothetical protein
MEEEKHTSVHLAIAKRIVDTLADGDCHVSQLAALQVLRPLLEDNLPPLILKKHKIPEQWFAYEMTAKESLIQELASYL